MTIIHGDLADAGLVRPHLLIGVCLGCSGPFCGGGPHTLLFTSAFHLWASREACPLVCSCTLQGSFLQVRNSTLHGMLVILQHLKCELTWGSATITSLKRKLKMSQGPVPFPSLCLATSGSTLSSEQDPVGAMLISREEKDILWHLGIMPIVNCMFHWPEWRPMSILEPVIAFRPFRSEGEGGAPDRLELTLLGKRRQPPTCPLKAAPQTPSLCITFVWCGHMNLVNISDFPHSR